MKAKAIVFLMISVVFYSFIHFDLKNLRIKRMKSLLSGDITDYFYDTAGRILQTQNSNGRTTAYHYYGNKIIVYLTDSTQNTFALATDTFFLNDKNRVAIAKHRMVNEHLEYDSSGRLIKSNIYMMEKLRSEEVWEWKGKNKTSSIVADNCGSGTPTSYLYYKDQPSTISQRNTGMEYMGQDSEDLLKQIEYTKPTAKDSSGASYSFKYEFERNGAVKLKAVYNKSGKLMDSIAYSYY